MRKFTLKVTPALRSVLERCTTEGTLFFLPPGERLSNYKEINACLEAAGGKWNKSKKAHVFPSNAAVILTTMLSTGQVKDHAKENKVTRQAFYTPAPIARTVAMYADLRDHLVLEPSAGAGSLALACMEYGATAVHCIEIDAAAASALPYTGICADFLKCLPRTPDVPSVMRHLYGRIVMNPPFTRKSDLKHVMHAFAHWLPIGGLLTAIVADDRDDRQDIQSALAGTDATFVIKERLGPGSFKESGTNIATLIIQIGK